MHIVGGLYREQCYIPQWDAVFGSGGRAAIAVSNLSSETILHTYSEDTNSEVIASLRKLGVEVCIAKRPTNIVFAYFHPLSRPYIQPTPSDIKQQKQLLVSGDTVLRFGFLEGDAIVEAHRAVYDPQTWRNPSPFAANGSRADELAVVLNELELESATNIHNIAKAASYLMDQHGAKIVIVKQATRGALVFEKNKKFSHIPAYRSPKVFKIGTGDVFSAIFTHYWAENDLSATEAADIASRYVAAYCGTSRLPIASDELGHLEPIHAIEHPTVLLEGYVNTIGRRYTLEEARFILQQLNMEVICPQLDSQYDSLPNVVLILADGIDDDYAKRILDNNESIPIVVLRENGVKLLDSLTDNLNVIVTDDFTSAIYFSAWAAT